MSDELNKKYEALKKQLEETTSWPSLYMFKFIVPADNHKVAQVEALFDSSQAKINTRTSKNGNFVSITAVEMMITPESIIERYRSAEGIEGLLSL